MEEITEYTYEESDSETSDDNADYSFDEVESTTSEESELPDEEYEYVVLSPSEIVQHMSDIVDEANSVLQLPPTTARMLLSHFNWDKVELLEKFYDVDQDQLFREANVIKPFKQISSTVKDEEKCKICYTIYAPAHKTELGCCHSFCNKCWNQYLTTKIVDEGVGQTIVCAAHKCPILVDYETVMRLVDDANVKDKYQHLITNSFVESNRHTRWCPSPGCEYAIKVEYIKFASVVCKCGHTFCFSCGEDWHDPINCAMLKKWIKKCNDHSEMSIWLLENTKECPSCKTNIEKNGGCYHMICKKGKCKAEFCWQCLGPWAPHGNAYYQCNRYNEEEVKAARDSQEQSRAELNRCAFFCNRYMTQKRWFEFEHTSIYSSVTDKMEKMMRELNVARPDVQFLQDGLVILRKSRRTLMYAYVFAYHLKKNNQSVIFKDNYKSLEICTKSLSQVLEKDEIITMENSLTSVRCDVKGWYDNCETMRTMLLSHLHEGYNKHWWQANTPEMGLNYVL